MVRALKDLKACFADLTSQNDALKDRCFSLGKSAEETAQVLAAKDRELKGAVAAKNLAIAERDQISETSEAECARLRKSRADHVAQVDAKGQRRLDKVGTYLKEQKQAEEVLSIHNQAEGILEMINLLIKKGHAKVGDGILEELEKRRIEAKEAAEALGIRELKTPDLTMTPDPLAISLPSLPRPDDALSVIPEGIDQHGTNVGAVGEMGVFKDSASGKAP